MLPFNQNVLEDKKMTENYDLGMCCQDCQQAIEGERDELSIRHEFHVQKRLDEVVRAIDELMRDEHLDSLHIDHDDREENCPVWCDCCGSRSLGLRFGFYGMREAVRVAA